MSPNDLLIIQSDSEYTRQASFTYYIVQRLERAENYFSRLALAAYDAGNISAINICLQMESGIVIIDETQLINYPTQNVIPEYYRYRNGVGWIGLTYQNPTIWIAPAY